MRITMPKKREISGIRLVQTWFGLTATVQGQRASWGCEFCTVMAARCPLQPMLGARPVWLINTSDGSQSFTLNSNLSPHANTTRGRHTQLTVGRKVWLYRLPELPPIWVPPPVTQIRSSTKAEPTTP
jgi:hypothetical protein